MEEMNSNTKSLLFDLVIIIFSIGIALLLVKMEFLGEILTSTRQQELLGSFIAGMFFTSVFTTAPATVALGEIALHGSLWLTALLGALGAVIIDGFMFKFVKDRFSEHLLKQIKEKGRLKSLLRLKLFRRFSFLIGGIIIASPLPDELGISILGLSRIKMRQFIPFSFISNFIGILLIGIIARAIV